MKLNAKLTRREREIAELLAWGATKKDAARHFFISVRTVENHVRNIFEKTECTKVNELSAWWFCYRFRIPITLSPLARKITASILLAVYLSGAANFYPFHQRIRISPLRTVSYSMRYVRKNNHNFKILVA